jgi:hypothetical protein
LVQFPPGNRTDWDEINDQDYNLLRAYLRNVSVTARWQPGSCLPAFPSSANHQDIDILQGLLLRAKANQEQQQDHHSPPATKYDNYNDNNTSTETTGIFQVDDPDPLPRLQDTLAGRKELCLYNEELQREPIIHFQMNHQEKLRLLTHFYAFIFFEDWRDDLWMKRFVRDHLHYRDEIQCAAARVVQKIRHYVYQKTNGRSTIYDSFHIRRGDFQFKTTRLDAKEIYENSKNEFTPGTTIYVATDERDKSFFDPLREHYDLLFLDDFKEDVLKNVNCTSRVWAICFDIYIYIYMCVVVFVCIYISGC